MQKYAPDGIITAKVLMDIFADPQVGFVEAEERKTLEKNNGTDKTPQTVAALNKMFERMNAESTGKWRRFSQAMVDLAKMDMLPHREDRKPLVHSWADTSDAMIFAFAPKYAALNDQKRYILAL